MRCPVEYNILTAPAIGTEPGKLQTEVGMKKKKNQFYAGKKDPVRTRKILGTVLTLLFILGVGVGAFLIVRNVREKKAEKLVNRSPAYCEHVFEPEPLAGMKDFKFYAGDVAVYTDSESGLKGLISLEGKVLTEPLYTEFSFVDNGWHNTLYIAYPNNEEYPRIVKIAEMRVDKKQYQGAGEEEKPADALWNTATNELSWYDSTGCTGPVAPEEAAFENGLYAVTDDKNRGSKFGYINPSLELAVPVQYDAAVDFSGGAGAVCTGEKWGFIDAAGTELISSRYSSVAELTVAGDNYCFGFRQGLAPVLENGKMGVVDKSGKIVVDFEYDAILQGGGGKYIAEKEGVWGLITLSAVPEEETETFTDASEGSRFNSGEYVITTSGSPLRLRASASTDATVLASIPNGTKVTVSKSVSGWAFVAYNSYEGWVSTDFITPAENSTEQ